jgi:hypothetical protein
MKTPKIAEVKMVAKFRLVKFLACAVAPKQWFSKQKCIGSSFDWVGFV